MSPMDRSSLLAVADLPQICDEEVYSWILVILPIRIKTNRNIDASHLDSLEHHFHLGWWYVRELKAAHFNLLSFCFWDFVVAWWG